MLGRLEGEGAGLIVVLPGIQQMVRVDLRVVTRDEQPQDVISRDNVSVQVNALVFFRVVDPHKAIIQVQDYLPAPSALAQTTLRVVLGKHELDEMLAQQPAAMQLRHLQTMTQVAGDRATTVGLPLPLDLIGPLLAKQKPQTPPA